MSNVDEVAVVSAADGFDAAAVDAGAFAAQLASLIAAFVDVPLVLQVTRKNNFVKAYLAIAVLAFLNLSALLMSNAQRGSTMYFGTLLFNNLTVDARDLVFSLIFLKTISLVWC